MLIPRMWGKIVPESIEKEPLEKLGSKTIYEKYDSKGAPPGISDAKESTYNAGDPGSIPGLGRSLENGLAYPLQYSYLENSRDRGAWWARVHGVAKSWI